MQPAITLFFCNNDATGKRGCDRLCTAADWSRLLCKGRRTLSEQWTDLEGGCLCGSVRYRVTGPPKWAAHCHCRSCQRATGAAFASWAGLRSDDLAMLKGSVSIYHSSPGVDRGFCSTCGTSLTYANGDAWPGEIHILLPTLDDPSAITPKIHAYTADQITWIKLDDGLRRKEHF